MRRELSFFSNSSTYFSEMCVLVRMVLNLKTRVRALYILLYVYVTTRT
jgi:hypothetical protein